MPKTDLQRSQEAHKETKIALKESREIFRLLVDAVEDYAIFALDTEGYIMTWNAGARRLKGYEPAEVIGTHFSRFYTAPDIERQHPQFELETAAKFGKYEEEGWRIRKDGSRFWANVVITALRDHTGELKGFGKVTRDLSQRRQAEMALKISEERFRLMIENVQDYAIFMLDPQGRVATWNYGAERNKGYTAQEIIGQHFSTFYPDEDRRAGKPEWELGEATKNGRVEDEGWRIRKDGSKFWANVIITAIYDQNKKLVGFSKVTRNLTERKMAEEKLRQAYNELEEKIQLRTEELSNAIQARDQFFSMASHELKTPLFAMKLQSQLRQRSLKAGKFGEISTEKLLELFAEDDRQADRLTRLVERMLDITKLTSGNLDLSLGRVNLYDMLQDITRQFAPILAQTKNEIFLSVPTDIFGTWDRLRMEQVLINLLTNAGKYAPGKPVMLSAKVHGNRILIEVQDFGSGISPENQKRIFEPFERIKGQIHVQGLGLGLFIARKIIELHGGHLSVNSVVDQGSRFIVDIPLHSRESKDEPK